MLICCFSIWGGGISAFSQSNDDFNPPNPDEPASINYCRLIVSADPAEGAYVSGGGKYVVGTSGQVYVSTNACNTEDYTYTFLYWTLNGVQTSYSQSFWFTPQKGKFELVAHYEKAEVVFDPNNPQEPSATDAKRKYRLYLTSSIEGACSFNITSGDKHIEQTPLSISAYVNAGYQFDGWKLNGVMLDYNTSPYLYINMPSANSTLEACVSEIPFDPDSPMEPSGQNTGIDTSGRKIVNLSIGNSNQSVDHTRVVFNEERTLAYEQGYDASKFISTDAAFQIYSLGDNNTKYSVNQRPAGDGNVPLGIVVKQAGEVTISATRLDCTAYLVDKTTDYWHDLSKKGYTFNSEAGTFENRFYIKVGAIPDIPLVKADNKTREYGDENPALTYTIENGELTGTPALSTTANKQSSVGTYPITISKGTIQGAYRAEEGTLTITNAPLTISGRTYIIVQGGTIPEFTLDYSGFKNNETASVLTTLPTATITATANSAPGAYPVTVSGGKAQNYDLSYTNGTLIILAKGDANGDGVIDTQDAIKVVQYYLGKNPTDFNIQAADVNNDGVVDTQDAIQIIKIYLKK
jgi:hypothetical protein